MGSGDLTAFQLIAYVASYHAKVSDPSDIDSSMQEHDAFNFFGLDLSSAHDDNYSSYVNSVAAPSSSAPASPSSTSAPPSSTSSASGATQTAVSHLFCTCTFSQLMSF